MKRLITHRLELNAEESKVDTFRWYNHGGYKVHYIDIKFTKNKKYPTLVNVIYEKVI